MRWRGRQSVQHALPPVLRGSKGCRGVTNTPCILQLLGGWHTQACKHGLVCQIRRPAPTCCADCCASSFLRSSARCMKGRANRPLLGAPSAPAPPAVKGRKVSQRGVKTMPAVGLRLHTQHLLQRGDSRAPCAHATHVDIRLPSSLPTHPGAAVSTLPMPAQRATSDTHPIRSSTRHTSQHPPSSISSAAALTLLPMPRPACGPANVSPPRGAPSSPLSSSVEGGVGGQAREGGVGGQARETGKRCGGHTEPPNTVTRSG